MGHYVVVNCCRCLKDFEDKTNKGNARICEVCRKPKPLYRARKCPNLRGKPLSPREGQIVDMVIEGKLNKEIAYDLHLTEGTIKVFLSNAFFKAGVINRTALAVKRLRKEI